MKTDLNLFLLYLSALLIFHFSYFFSFFRSKGNSLEDERSKLENEILSLKSEMTVKLNKESESKKPSFIEEKEIKIKAERILFLEV